jgi:hypothetical protein
VPNQASETNGAADDDSGGAALGARKRRRAWEVEEDAGDGAEGPNSEDEAEAKRVADQKEKAEFEERLRARDEARTRKIAEAKLSAEELAVRLYHFPCLAHSITLANSPHLPPLTYPYHRRMHGTCC